MAAAEKMERRVYCTLTLKYGDRKELILAGDTFERLIDKCLVTNVDIIPPWKYRELNDAGFRGSGLNLRGEKIRCANRLTNRCCKENKSFDSGSPC